jgi:hypothetical protein
VLFAVGALRGRDPIAMRRIVVRWCRLADVCLGSSAFVRSRALLCGVDGAMPYLVKPLGAAAGGPVYRRGADERLMVERQVEAARTAAVSQRTT